MNLHALGVRGHRPRKIVIRQESDEIAMANCNLADNVMSSFTRAFAL